MDNKSPRTREIMGPRPTPLKVNKDSHKITKKPPLAPPQQPPPQLQRREPPQPLPPRAPVIIYTISPRIIHTHPDNFMALVQRLTGNTSTSTTSSTSAPNHMSASEDTSGTMDASRGSISPAARYASTEKANASNYELGFAGDVASTDQFYHHHHQTRAIERPSFHQAGILSPGPTSLPPISPGFFSTVVGPSDPQGSSSFFNDLNSILQTSPSTMPSPSSMDLFNNFFDS
ncbi:hypothetical protein EUTSA_v10008673mg [Eutrema salsugineum]|uniref:VQ domain-containing protein n=1 Tax=Eutrema salsugineum TaxID=72664 RepID=V4KTQ2_EUTSA|nr:nuclear speckle RNA-binding protein B [Eutrema salsugineum]ESQ34669.1 hypothetical protein EUTSA_v10008673mg [Eutrema salsugineum]